MLLKTYRYHNFIQKSTSLQMPSMIRRINSRRITKVVSNVMRQRKKWRRMLTSFTTQRNCNLIVFGGDNCRGTTKRNTRGHKLYTQVTETLNTIGNWHVIYQNWHMNVWWAQYAGCAGGGGSAARRASPASLRLACMYTPPSVNSLHK